MDRLTKRGTADFWREKAFDGMQVGEGDAAGRVRQVSSYSGLMSTYWTSSASGQMTAQSSVANMSTFSYDGLGNRVRKSNPQVGETVLVYDVFGNMAAEYGAGATTACAPCYLFRDPVGTVRLVVDGTQTVVKRYDVMPFGEQITAGAGWANGRSGDVYSPASTVKWRFGGGYKDDQSGEWPGHEMGARQYNPGYGRFVTPDENLADQDVGDPLSWNLYAYARNNPLRYSDPTGRACVQQADGGYADDGGPGQSCAEATTNRVGHKVTVAEIAPPSDLLLAVARGAQRAESTVKWVGVATAFVTGVAGAGAGVGAAGGSGLVSLGVSVGLAMPALAGSAGQMVRKAVEYVARFPGTAAEKVGLLKNLLNRVAVSAGNWSYGVDK